MSSTVPHLSCFLVEWYHPELGAEPLERAAAALDECAAALTTEGCPVQLLMTVAAPTDDVAFGVFAAGSAHLVSQVCQRAGVPAQRLSAATAGRPARRS